MRCHPGQMATNNQRFGKKLDMSSDAAGITPTGDRAVASSQTSRKAVADCGRVTAGADSNRRTFVLYRFGGSIAWIEMQESNLRQYD